MDEEGIAGKGRQGDGQTLELAVVKHEAVGLAGIDHRQAIDFLTAEDASCQFPGELTLPVTTDQFAAYNAVPEIDIPQGIDRNGAVATDPRRGFPVHQLASRFIGQQAIEENDRVPIESRQPCLQLGKRQIVPERDLEWCRQTRQSGRKAVPIDSIGGYRGAADDNDFFRFRMKPKG